MAVERRDAVARSGVVEARCRREPNTMQAALPPTSATLGDDRTRPYFLWWTTATVGDLRAHLSDPDPDVRAYWLGALLREANTRDVWLFVTPDVIRESWNRLQRHLGRTRSMWAYLLNLPDRPWPPSSVARG
jgi:hypothetical protein